ncbi:MAG: hypothetical protein ABIV92_07170, partial [Thermoflexales bacterium]
ARSFSRLSPRSTPSHCSVDHFPSGFDMSAIVAEQKFCVQISACAGMTVAPTRGMTAVVAG